MHAAVTFCLFVPLLLLSLPALLACLYLVSATVLSARLPRPPASSRQLRFDVVVPAHNESSVIARTVASMRKLDWPADRYRILVVADNCTDTTAAIAAEAGAQVLERNDPSFRGKGYALDFAFRYSAAAGWADAVVIVDADSEGSGNLLEACAARIEQGAHAVQVHYGVLNPWASWRTRLITIAKAAFHIVRSRARERLKVSCGIRGNGWCVTHSLLRAQPYRAFSLTEDVEYGIDLGLAGWRVHYADEAHVDGEMVSSAQAASQQRRRWEGGRFELIRTRTLPLLAAALRRPSRICFDLALDLLVLPLSYVVINVIALALLALLASWWDPLLMGWLAVAALCILSMLLYVLRGWQLSGMGARGLADLAVSPIFLVWKVALMLRRRGSGEWVRTDREHS